MKDIFVKTNSPVRSFFPLVRKLRGWAWKFHDRTATRLVISGGRARFMDVDVNFPEGMAYHYSTQLYWNGPEAYEIETSRTLAMLMERSRLFLDIGSNIGIYSVYAGKKFPNLKTYAFEPVPRIWEKNCAFHRANQLNTDCILKVALGDRDGHQKIFLPVYETGWEEEETGTLRADSWQSRHAKVETIEIECQTLDTFAAERQLPEGTCCLKIDVENFEAGVLRGGKNFIRQRRPWIVCEILPDQEFDPVTNIPRNNNQETVALIGDVGYRIFAITRDGLFRMGSADFDRSRRIKDFLLVPQERIPAETFYLPLSDVAKLV